MRRRGFVALLGSIAFGGAAALWRGLAAFGKSVESGIDNVTGPETHLARTVAAVADAMFPGDGLPGAVELGLHSRILAMPDLADVIARGVAWLDAGAVRKGAADFTALDEAGRLAAIDAAFASGDDSIQRFVLALRSRLMTAYYAEPAVKAAFAYAGPPQPDGFADFQDPPA